MHSDLVISNKGDTTDSSAKDIHRVSQDELLELCPKTSTKNAVQEFHPRISTTTITSV
jgi:hypothetical protein